MKATPVKGDRTDGSGLDAQFRRGQLLRPCAIHVEILKDFLRSEHLGLML